MPSSENGTEMPSRVLVVGCQDHGGGLAMLLKHLLGCEVRVAYNADSATQAARELNAQVALIDTGIPWCNGYELARNFRGSREFSELPLIAISCYSSTPYRDLARQAGFNGYIVKPYGIETLREALATAGGQPMRPIGSFPNAKLPPERRPVS